MQRCPHTTMHADPSLSRPHTRYRIGLGNETRTARVHTATKARSVEIRSALALQAMLWRERE